MRGPTAAARLSRVVAGKVQPAAGQTFISSSTVEWRLHHANKAARRPNLAGGRPAVNRGLLLSISLINCATAFVHNQPTACQMMIKIQALSCSYPPALCAMVALAGLAGEKRSLAPLPCTGGGRRRLSAVKIDAGVGQAGMYQPSAL